MATINNKAEAMIFLARFAIAKDNTKRDNVAREGLAQAALFVLKEMVYETVKFTPNISTSEVDRTLCIDESIGGHEKWMAHAILNSLEKENRIKSEKIGRERQWFVVE